MDEQKRLATLRALEILDTPPEQRFDRLTKAAAEAFGAPIALVSLVDEDRQWFKSRVGLKPAQTPRSQSFCAHAIHGDDTFVVPDAHQDERFCANPLVTGDPNIRFYAGQPLVTFDGCRVGTLCVIDTKPRELTPDQQAILKRLALDAEAEINATKLLLGTFRVLEVLGRGGMGAVYKARDESLGRLVAIKVVLRSFLEDPTFRARFKREAQTLAAVAHPNVVTIFQVGEHHGVPYLVCEFLPGGTLEGRIVARGGRLPWREAVELGAQLARGLAAIHRADMIHRDLKPANILFDQGSRPKIGDFGLARAACDGPASSEPSMPIVEDLDRTITRAALVETEVMGAPARGAVGSPLTRPGTIQGTLLYMSPEQARGLDLDGRADLYSLGATLYAAIAGAPPLALTAQTLHQQILLEVPRPLGERVKELPKPLERLVAKLLEKDRDRRFPDADAVASELEALLQWKPSRSRPR